MQKVRIYALSSIASALIEKLHELGILEIGVSQCKGMQSGSPLESFNEISTLLVRMRGILSNLPKQNINSVHETKDAVNEARKIKVDEEVKGLMVELSKLEAELGKISEELKITKRLESFGGIDFSRLETRTTSYIFGSVSREKLNKAKEELSKTGLKHEFLFALHETTAYLLILFEKAGPDIELPLSRLGFTRFIVPPNLTTQEKYKFWLDRETKNKRRRVAEIKAELDTISARHYQRIADLEHSLSIAADRAEIASRFSFGKSTFIIEGWLEQKNVEKLDNLLKQYGDNAVLEKAKTGLHDAAPTVLENKDVVKPYQFLTESYAFPNSSELDPSLVYFFTIPLLYGMIVGDVIYGLISIVLALFFIKKFKGSAIMSSISRLWLFSAIPAILFGLVFDEFAGMTHYHLLEKLEAWGIFNLESLGMAGPLYLGISRLHNLTTVFQITLLVGMIHLALGLVMGAINEWHHSKKHAIGKLAWIGVELGGYLAISSFLFNAMPASIGNIGAGILALSAVLIAWSEGVVGILELPGIAGNVFSYMRIAVVGVVGAILAELINALFMPTPQQGILALIFFPLFILLHVINTFIAMFEAVIQGGRLNIIEFKLKFLKGGGRPFRPFAVKNMR